MNSTDRSISIDKGTVISEVVPVEPANVVLTPKPGTASYDNEKELQNIVDGVSPEVDLADRERLHALLSEYVSVFSFSETDIGRTSLVKHTIDTGDAKPVHKRLRKQLLIYQSIISEHIDTMLKQDIIEPTQSPWAPSPWAANLVLVKKNKIRRTSLLRGLQGSQ